MDGELQDWLFLFKNETHNHPTEIEPFGGAATCIGGAIRDPLSGRSYVYQAMRVTGAADPLTPVSETMPGKLPQRKLCHHRCRRLLLLRQPDRPCHRPGTRSCTTPATLPSAWRSARSSARAPTDNVTPRGRPRRATWSSCSAAAPAVTACGGATGSSKAHNRGVARDLRRRGAEGQRRPRSARSSACSATAMSTRLIKRCNDFGAGGVSVAIGELADGLDIDLNTVPKKYDGLDGTELAISEIAGAHGCGVVRRRTPTTFIAARRTRRTSRLPSLPPSPKNRACAMTWNGKTIVDVSREFLEHQRCAKHVTPTSRIPTASMLRSAGSRLP